MSNVMRQVFGAFGTAIIVTILQQRQAFHSAILSQGVTPFNFPMQQLLDSAQQWALSHGMSVAQSQMMGTMLAARQVATTAAVMGFDDVFRVTAAITLLAIIPAAFMSTKRAPAGRGPTILAD
jgi:DHA2 family multidrug resistance protein